MSRLKLGIISFAFGFSGLALAADHAVDIKDYTFVPQTITISVGDTITWTNREKRQYHSVWFEESGEPETDYFFPDDEYQRSFDEAGEFHYRCGPHPEMTGTVIVK